MAKKQLKSYEMSTPVFLIFECPSCKKETKSDFEYDLIADSYKTACVHCKSKIEINALNVVETLHIIKEVESVA